VSRSGVTTGNTNAFNLLQSLTNTDSTARTLSTVFSADEFKLVLSALQSQNMKLVSNPTVVTLNNSQATILIGQKYPIATPNITAGGAGGASNTITYSITEKDIGIKLEVLPQVNARGFIKLTVKPTVSSISAPSPSHKAPSIRSFPLVRPAPRFPSRTVTPWDRGLIQATDSKGETKVPILGSIPGIGRLFRSDTKNSESSNLDHFHHCQNGQRRGRADRGRLQF